MLTENLGRSGAIYIGANHAQQAYAPILEMATGVSASPYATLTMEFGKGREKWTIFPHKDVGKWLEGIVGKSETGRWMDADIQGIAKRNGVQVGWHRIVHHHPITDAIIVAKTPGLKLLDFYLHLVTDIVTRNGLPLLPEAACVWLSKTTGISMGKLMPWVHMNILDAASAGLAWLHAGQNIYAIASDQASWGAMQAVNTFGLGAIDVAAGYFTANPLLMAAGATDIACGGVMAYDYYTQPFVLDTPLYDVLGASGAGALVAAAFCGGELLLRGKLSKAPPLSTREKVALVAERVGTSAGLSALASVAAPLSITAGLTLSGVKMAKQAAEQTNRELEQMAVGGLIAEDIDRAILHHLDHQGGANQEMIQKGDALGKLHAQKVDLAKSETLEDNLDLEWHTRAMLQEKQRSERTTQSDKVVEEKMDVLSIPWQDLEYKNKEYRLEVLRMAFSRAFDTAVAAHRREKGVDGISYRDMERISAALQTFGPKALNTPSLPGAIEASLAYALAAVDPDKERSRQNLRKGLSLLGGSSGLALASVCLAQILNPGVWAIVVAFFAGGIAAGPLAVFGVGAGIAVAIGSVYKAFQKMTPPQRAKKAHDFVLKGFAQLRKECQA